MIFYHGPEVRISHERLWVLGPEPHDHALTDLQDLCVVLPGAGPSIMALTCSGTAAAAAAVVSFAATGAHHSAGWVCTLLAAGIGALQLKVVLRTPARLYELWAFDRALGQAVRLYTTTSDREFGRVRRALVRALEWNAASST